MMSANMKVQLMTHFLLHIFFNYISNHISENMIRIWFTFLKHN